MTNEEKYQGYTPMLSKRFSDYAGRCTLEEFKHTYIKSSLLFILYFFIFIIWGIFFCASLLGAIIKGVGIGFIVACLLGIGLIYCFYKHIGKPFLAAIIKRLHAHGKSFTRWVLIPDALYIFSVIVFCCVVDNVNYEAIIKYASILFGLYNSYFIWEICGKETPYDIEMAHAKNIAANSLVKNMRSAQPKAAPTLSKRPVVQMSKVRTTSTMAEQTIQKPVKPIPPVKPTPPTPPSHQ